MSIFGFKIVVFYDQNGNLQNIVQYKNCLYYRGEILSYFNLKGYFLTIVKAKCSQFSITIPNCPPLLAAHALTTLEGAGGLGTEPRSNHPRTEDQSRGRRRGQSRSRPYTSEHLTSVAGVMHLLAGCILTVYAVIITIAAEV